MTLVQRVLEGDRLALARMLSLVENETPGGQAALAELYPHTGRAHLVGITGPPGVGKSTLVNSLARLYRQPGEGTAPRTVAIVAVDPTSPFTGGAILGDRIRMRDLAGDPGIFIRSMATRGALGGLARATGQVTQTLDAAGFEVILIETVGAGQSEVEIASAAHTTVVIEAPGLGDDVQGFKAGILEIADVLVVNKSDLPGAENTVKILRGMLELGPPAIRLGREGRLPAPPAPRPGEGVRGVRPAQPGRAAPPVGPGKSSLPEDSDSSSFSAWTPPILKTVAATGEGVAELLAAIDRHRAHLATTGGLDDKERARAVGELEARLQQALLAGWREAAPAGAFELALKRVLARELDPARAVERLLNGSLK